MTEVSNNLSQEKTSETPGNLPPMNQIRIPQFRRDIHPANLVLSAQDIREFCELLMEANERSKEIEFQKLDLSKFDSVAQARETVDDFMQVEYNYVSSNGDSVIGLGLPDTSDRNFPEELKTVYISNANYSERSIKTRPLNTVDAFFDFERPTLKIDYTTLPSSPTNNRSIINVVGRDEDWVISTSDRIRSFFKKHAAVRPVVHASGTYDYFAFLVFMPAMLLLLYQQQHIFSEWLDEQSIVLNVLFGAYSLILILFAARFVFQYARWLFPPMEYYKRNRIGSYVHRGIAALLGTSLLLSATYDIFKTGFFWFFG